MATSTPASAFPAPALTTLQSLGAPAAGQTFEAPVSAFSDTAINPSAVAGTASFSLSGDTLTVDVSLVGLTPNVPVAMAITGLPGGSPVALPQTQTAAVDLGSPQSPLGSVVLDLATNAPKILPEGPGAHADAVFPFSADDGSLSYHQTFTFDPSNPAEMATLQALQSLGTHAMVVLGGTNGTAAAPVSDPNLVVGAGLLQSVPAVGSPTEAHAAATTLLG